MLVAGRAVKRDGKLVGYDVPKLVSQVEQARDHILGSAGLLPEFLLPAGAATA